MRNTADVTGGKPIAVLLQPISGVSAINPLVAFYIHGGKKELFFALTAGWSSGLRPRLRNQSSRVQIPVVGRGFCDEHLLKSHGCLYI
jgi:hypothetical protein